MERNRDPMNKNRIRGATEQGEQASDCEARVVKAQPTQTRRLCGEGSRSCLGRLALWARA